MDTISRTKEIQSVSVELLEHVTGGQYNEPGNQDVNVPLPGNGGPGSFGPGRWPGSGGGNR